jgi:hypothetical protein
MWSQTLAALLLVHSKVRWTLGAGSILKCDCIKYQALAPC